MNQKGQSLIEYLMIVALVAIGSLAVMRTLGHTVSVRFANITNALQNKDPNIQPQEIKKAEYQKRNLSDFFKGATSK